MADDLARISTALADRYTIERELGGGGMSRVFVAEEHALQRQVVIKVLPDAMAGQVSIERFKREIGLAAQLQHPHIVPLLTAGEADGLPYFTMPFVDGESLRGRLTRGGELPVGEAIRMLREVASALAYAHARGVVHRDIKPDNVLVAGGSAMVTDFGVAKALSLSSHADSTGITSVGVALGTPAYMAPEQAAADPHVDHRADIYAFGAMAYEMLTGQPPFAGRSAQAMLAAHVTEEPELMSRRRAGAPASLTQLVMRCLAKRPADRPQSAQEVIQALDAISAPSGGMEPTGARLRAIKPRRRVAILVMAASALVVAAVAYATWAGHASFTAYQTGTVRSFAAIPTVLEVEPGISHDGAQVAYAAQTDSGFRIYVGQIDGGPARALLTEKIAGDQRWPRWSPDGTKIVFVANGMAYVVPSGGGPPRRAIESPTNSVRTPSWSPDSKQFAFADDSGIWIRSVDGGGVPRSGVRGDFLHSPVWSPDGTRLAYVIGRRRWLDNSSSNAVWVVPISGRSPRQLSDSTHVNISPVWAPDGKSILYLSNPEGTTDLYQQALRGDASAVGKPHRLATALGAFTMTLSKTGERIAFDVVQDNTSIWEDSVSGRTMTTTASVTARAITNQNEHIEALDLSHDGNWLAYDSKHGGNSDIYKVPADGGAPTRLTHDAANNYGPCWSPGDSEIAFYSTRNGTRDIFVMSAEGNREVQVTSGPRDDYAPRWSPNGHQLVFMRISATKARELYLVAREGNGHWSEPIRISPDSVDDVQPVAAWIDSNRVAFASRGSVRVIAIDSRRVSILADSAKLTGLPSDLHWVTRGSAVFVRLFTTPGRIIAVPLAGEPRPVIKATPTRPFAWLVFATDGRRIFFTACTRCESDVSVMDLKR